MPIYSTKPAVRTCRMDGCDTGGRIVRGLCRKHYNRFLKHGDPHTVTRINDPKKRFKSRISKSQTGCWVWTGTVGSDGYGRISIGGSNKLSHRISYEWNVGPIPDGLVLDHLCRNRACVNPGHLEPVTHRTNILRGVGQGAINASKTHCVHGHELTEDNVYMRNGTWRKCRTCVGIRQGWYSDGE